MSAAQQGNDPIAASGKPTRGRFVVLTFLCALAFVLYLDRICISQAMPTIQKQFSLSNTQVSCVLAAFTLAYGLFELPTGHWADRIGSRAVLTRISIWWSIFTAMTAASMGFWSLLLIRFLFGAGEAGAYPNAARIFARWFPPGERGRAQGLLQTSALVGGAVAPLLSAYLIRYIGWRWTFVLYGTTGVVWAAFFYAWFSDDPAQHPSVNQQELATIGVKSDADHRHLSIPWRRVARSSCILLLGLIMTCASFNSYVYFSWFPTYLQKARMVSPEFGGALSSLVLLLSAAGNLAGGAIADRITRWSADPVRVRRRICSLAFALSALLLGLGVVSESVVTTSILAGAATMTMQVTLASWWSCAIEVSGRHVGALFGLMNGIGGFGAMASQFFFGVFVDWRMRWGFTGRAQWDPAFFVVVAVLLVAAVAWQFVDSSRPIDAGQNPPTDPGSA